MADNEYIDMDSFPSSGIDYYMVADDCWAEVTAQISERAGRHIQRVPPGQGPMVTAGQAGTWLGKNKVKLRRLFIVGHGGPGSIRLGVSVTSENVAPLGGWLSSFFTSSRDTQVILLGCNCAADSIQKISGLYRGQHHDIGDTSLSHRGYNLLQRLSNASVCTVEGPLEAQTFIGLSLKMSCLRVFPNTGGMKAAKPIVFEANGIRGPGT
jgi:hypothetical protein